MLQFNPVMAAKYQALTQAADAAEQQATATASQVSAAAAAGRARRARARVACAASLLRWLYSMVVHGTSWDAAAAAARPACPPPAAVRRRLLTSAYAPHPLRVPETFLPYEGESEPVPASGTTPYDTLGALPRSPGASHQPG